MKKFTVTEKTNLKDFTDAVYPQGSFCLAQLLREKDIKVNGVRVNKNIALNSGDEVLYYTNLKQEQTPSHTVVYEDENIYIADKPSGVACEGLFSELNKFYPVHRLDRNTEGLLVLAKNNIAEAELLAAFRERKVDKTYLAICKNNFKSESGVLTAYLLKDGDKGEVKIISSPRADAVKIITEYEVLNRSGDTALVKIILHTGKTHQIRAHMAFIGCPVLGDEKYGDGALNKKYAARRQRLVAKYLSFELSGKLSYLSGRTFESGYDLN